MSLGNLSIYILAAEFVIVLSSCLLVLIVSYRYAVSSNVGDTVVVKAI